MRVVDADVEQPFALVDVVLPVGSAGRHERERHGGIVVLHSALNLGDSFVDEFPTAPLPLRNRRIRAIDWHGFGPHGGGACTLDSGECRKVEPNAGLLADGPVDASRSSATMDF